MNNWKIKKLATNIKFACAFLFLMTGVACSHDPLTITGRVVDESGNSLSDVSVWACYSGWGWGEGEAGYLVWDKDYCSETTQTNHDGLYIITFKGPVSSRLRTKKDGWVQRQDFNTTHSRIVLTRSEDHSSRLRDEAQQRDLEHRQRRAGESETDYYCRVIFPEKQSVNLNYRDETLGITTTLLENSARSEALFAVRGSFTAVNILSDELVVTINGEAPGSNVSFKRVETSCGLDVQFIGVSIPGLNGLTDARLEVLVPSANAMLNMQILSHSTQR
jgi:hypothetical protein